jgi:hypothetical protein
MVITKEIGFNLLVLKTLQNLLLGQPHDLCAALVGSLRQAQEVLRQAQEVLRQAWGVFHNYIKPQLYGTRFFESLKTVVMANPANPCAARNKNNTITA